jgi:hypothetical protein
MTAAAANPHPAPAWSKIFVRRYLGHNRAEWGCFRADHAWMAPMLAPRDWKRLQQSEVSARLMAHWWRREAGGCIAWCPRCRATETADFPRGCPVP